MAGGVNFWLALEADGGIVGVMGLQEVRDVTLIRHAYVLPSRQRSGIGGRLVEHLLARCSQPTLVGTWAAAEWAIAFYEKHGFRRVPPAEKERLLRAYWAIPARQIETSVVLADERARSLGMGVDEH
jgi:N-acetylglutamate synthase-like GNAT family acetyltransferase